MQAESNHARELDGPKTEVLGRVREAHRHLARGSGVGRRDLHGAEAALSGVPAAAQFEPPCEGAQCEGHP